MSSTVLPGLVRTLRMERLLQAPPERVHRAWADPEELASWFPYSVEGSLLVGARTTLVWPARRVWWDVLESEPPRSFRFRWPWLPDDSYVTQVTVRIDPRGYGSRLVLTDGPFDLSLPGVLDEYVEALEGWAEALASLQAQLDHSVDLRLGQ